MVINKHFIKKKQDKNNQIILNTRLMVTKITNKQNIQNNTIDRQTTANINNNTNFNNFTEFAYNNPVNI